MNEIEHEGKIYILKSSVESIIKDRISKIASKANQAEQRANELETSYAELENKTASLDVIAQQLEEMKGKLQQSETRFSRYQAVSKYGITEPEIIEAIEYSYDKSMKSKNADERVSLDNWISGHINTPENAPVLLRPHLVQINGGKQPQTTSTPEQPKQEQNERPPITSHNQNTVKPPEKQNLIQQGIKDGKFYKENREAIRNLWLSQSRR